MRLFYAILALTISLSTNAQNEIREYIIDSAKQAYLKQPEWDCSKVYKGKTITFDYNTFKIPAQYGTAVIEYRVNQEREEHHTMSRDKTTWSYYKCLNALKIDCVIQLVSPPFEGKNYVELYVSDQANFYVFYMRAKDEIYKHIRSKEGWIFIGESTEGDLHYIRNKYEEKTDGYIKVWQKTILKKKEVDDKIYNDVKLLILEKFDCKRSMYFPASLAMYDSEGNVLRESDLSKYADKWQDIIPDTFLEQKFIFACSKLER